MATHDLGVTAQLSDGRQLAYIEYGDPRGKPFFFFTGLGTTRVVRHPDDSIAASLGLRVIAVDRPGIGLSDPQPGRRMLDWPDDIRELADQLGVGAFGLIGWSGGGAYALACAYRLPDRVTAVGIISGPAPLSGLSASSEYLGPWFRMVSQASRHAPWMVRLAIWHWGRPQRRDPERFLEKSIKRMVAADQAVLADPRLRELMIENAAEIYRHGWQGMVEDSLIVARPWGFDPASVSVPVFLWHGECDPTVPPAMGRHLARSIPDSVAHFYPDEGHLLLYNRWHEILRSLAA